MRQNGLISTKNRSGLDDLGLNPNPRNEAFLNVTVFKLTEVHLASFPVLTVDSFIWVPQPECSYGHSYPC